MHPVVRACVRAIRSQLHVRMLLLTFMPFMVAISVLGVMLWLGLQPLMDILQQYFSAHDGFRLSSDTLAMFGMGAVKTLIVPLLAMWMLLPLMIVTALLLIGLIVMPVIGSHVGRHHFPALDQRKGGTLWGSIRISLTSFVAFVLMWLATLPLGLFPPLLFAVQALLWGWLTSRVMVYDALASHASVQERIALSKKHAWPLLVIGIAGGALGTLPTLFWLGGVLSFVLLPVLATVSIWLYVLVFVFTGLWFQYYCLDALEKMRQSDVTAPALSEQDVAARLP